MFLYILFTHIFILFNFFTKIHLTKHPHTHPHTCKKNIHQIFHLYLHNYFCHINLFNNFCLKVLNVFSHFFLKFVLHKTFSSEKNFKQITPMNNREVADVFKCLYLQCLKRLLLIQKKLLHHVTCMHIYTCTCTWYNCGICSTLFYLWQRILFVWGFINCAAIRHVTALWTMWKCTISLSSLMGLIKFGVSGREKNGISGEEKGSDTKWSGIFNISLLLTHACLLSLMNEAWFNIPLQWVSEPSSSIPPHDAYFYQWISTSSVINMISHSYLAVLYLLYHAHG